MSKPTGGEPAESALKACSGCLRCTRHPHMDTAPACGSRKKLGLGMATSNDRVYTTRIMCCHGETNPHWGGADVPSPIHRAFSASLPDLMSASLLSFVLLLIPACAVSLTPPASPRTTLDRRAAILKAPAALLLLSPLAAHAAAPTEASLLEELRAVRMAIQVIVCYVNHPKTPWAYPLCFVGHSRSRPFSMRRSGMRCAQC